MPSGDYIIVGKILSTQGIKGFVSIQSYTSNSKDIFSYKLKVLSDTLYKDITIMEYNFMPKKITMKIEGINNIEQATEYIGKNLYMSKKDLPITSNDEYYWHQLIGLKVINEEDVNLGVVNSIFSSGNNDILVIKTNDSDEEVFMPFLKSNLVKIDSDAIFVRWKNEL